jgi:hypothetical protein
LTGQTTTIARSLHLSGWCRPDLGGIATVAVSTGVTVIGTGITVIILSFRSVLCRQIVVELVQLGSHLVRCRLTVSDLLFEVNGGVCDVSSSHGQGDAYGHHGHNTVYDTAVCQQLVHAVPRVDCFRR